MRGVFVFGAQIIHAHVHVAEQLITHHLHRLRQIQREIIRVAVDGHQAVARHHFFDAQTKSFIAKHQRHFFATARRINQAWAQFARCVHGGGKFAFAAGQGAAHGGVGQSLLQSRHDARVFQHIFRARSQDKAFFWQGKITHGLRIELRHNRRHWGGNQIGRDQHQLGQTHGFHGPCGRAYVGWMRSARQHHGNIL